MTDTELLKSAAKAAGVCLHPADKLRRSYGNWGCDTTCTVCNEDPSDAQWRPLTDDGDALRLAVKLNIDFYMGADSDGPEAWAGYYVPGRDNKLHACVPVGKDPYAATRRAIVRAAAEIGKESI